MAASDPRRTVPIRRHGPYDESTRNELLERQAATANRIREIDAQQVELSRERASLARESRDLQDQLFPPDWELHGRAPQPHSVAETLPPIPANAQPVSGQRLRTLCLRLLHRVGRCSLRRLHALIHLHGYWIDASYAVKALGDALAHEADAGRAYRIARGVYRVAPGIRFRRPPGDRPDDLILPYLDQFDDELPELDQVS